MRGVVAFTAQGIPENCNNQLLSEHLRNTTLFLGQAMAKNILMWSIPFGMYIARHLLFAHADWSIQIAAGAEIASSTGRIQFPKVVIKSFLTPRSPKVIKNPVKLSPALAIIFRHLGMK